MARKVLANRTDAEDAVQEVFLELWRSADRFDPNIASARAFVATIARRRLMDRGRVVQRQTRGMRPLELAEPVRSSATSARGADVASLNEQARTALRELERLRPEQRDVLQLSVQSGWTHEQIATYLAIPLGTVKTHIRRGMLRIRDALAGTPARESSAEEQSS